MHSLRLSDLEERSYNLIRKTVYKFGLEKFGRRFLNFTRRATKKRKKQWTIKELLRTDLTKGKITSRYGINDQWSKTLKVPHSLLGTIYTREEVNAVVEVMSQEVLTSGINTIEFQKEFAEYTGVKYAFAVGNCTQALDLATTALGIGKGDEVIVTPNTFIATSLAIVRWGAHPVYADIDPRTYNINPNEIKKKITAKTKAIYIVHYAGQICDMDPIMELAKTHDLVIVEDCAHAPGAEYKGKKAGSIGDIGCFSFQSLKNMSTLGEGGMITTNRDDLVDKIGKLRNMNTQGWPSFLRTDDYWYPSHFDVEDVDGYWGCNYRMSESQAAVGRIQLSKLDTLNDYRRHLAHRITKGITNIKGITPAYEDPNCKHVYHLYTLCVEEKELGVDRDEFLRILYREEGIMGILHYQPTYDFTGWKKMGYGEHLCPEAEKFFYKRELNLPLFPRLTDKHINIIVEGIRSATEKVKKRLFHGIAVKADNEKEMPNRVGIGIVGAGSIGIRGALEHLSQPDVQDRISLAAVCDPIPGRAEAIAKKYGVKKHYLNYEELLADKNVDAVVLCSPTEFHYSQGIAAIEAGKHIHFNKTITVTTAEADGIIEKSKEKGVHIIASPGTMTRPHNRRIRRQILEGKIGKVVWAIVGTTGAEKYHLSEGVRKGNSMLSNIDPSWYFKKPAGGPQYDVTVYCLHNLTGILGPAKRVTALSGKVTPERFFRHSKIECEVDDSTLLLLDFGEATFGFVYATAEDGGLTAEPFQPTIYGTEGVITGTISDGHSLKFDDDAMPHEIGPHLRMEESHVFEDTMQLVDLIREGKPSIVNTFQARHVIEIIEAGYRANRTGETQTLHTSFEPLTLETLQ